MSDSLWPHGHQAPPSMGFSRQEYCSGLPFPSPGNLPDPRIEPRSPALQADSLLSEPPGKLEQTISLAYSWATLAPLIRPNWGARQILSSLTITSLPYPGTLKKLTIKNSFINGDIFPWNIFPVSMFYFLLWLKGNWQWYFLT